MALLVVGGAAACAGSMHPAAMSPASGASSSSSEMEAGPVITIDLTYRRPDDVQSAGRPDAFYVIADYHRESAVTEYPGSWDEETQTLSAIVCVPLRAENLVYVQDSVLTPGAATQVTAARGTLKETPCPARVDPLNSCHLLQVLR